MSRHTPGPWRVVTGSIADQDGWPLFCVGPHTVFSGPMHGDSMGSYEDDARLIAAAPELADALQVLVRAAMGIDRIDFAVVRAKAALRKAGVEV